MRRFFNHNDFQAHIIRKFTNRLVSLFISSILLHKKEFYDIQSSFRVFNRTLAVVLNKSLEGNYNYAQEMFIITSILGYRIKQYPIKCYERTIGNSKLIKNPLYYLSRITWISFKTYIKYKVKI